MSTYPNLPNAPIREALIDIQVKLPEKIDIDHIEEFGNKISANYPQKRKRMLATLKYKPGQPPPKPEERHIGWKFISADKKRIIQARLNGFTYSRLRQYENWSNLREEAYRMWRLYSDFFKPISIERVACRYINEIRLKQPVKLHDYLSALPGRPKGAPEILASFITRVVIPYEDIGALAIVTQVLEKVADDGAVPIILDIDVFKSDHFETEGSAAWDFVDKFREIKNNLFFGCITEKTVEMYK